MSFAHDASFCASCSGSIFFFFFFALPCKLTGQLWKILGSAAPLTTVARVAACVKGVDGLS